MFTAFKLACFYFGTKYGLLNSRLQHKDTVKRGCGLPFQPRPCIVWLEWWPQPSFHTSFHFHTPCHTSISHFPWHLLYSPPVDTPLYTPSHLHLPFLYFRFCPLSLFLHPFLKNLSFYTPPPFYTHLSLFLSSRKVWLRLLWCVLRYFGAVLATVLRSTRDLVPCAQGALQ